MLARKSHSFTCHPHSNHTCLYSPAAKYRRPLAVLCCCCRNISEITLIDKSFDSYITADHKRCLSLSLLSQELAQRRIPRPTCWMNEFICQVYTNNRVCIIHNTIYYRHDGKTETALIAATWEKEMAKKSLKWHTHGMKCCSQMFPLIARTQLHNR